MLQPPQIGRMTNDDYGYGAERQFHQSIVQSEDHYNMQHILPGLDDDQDIVKRDGTPSFSQAKPSFLQQSVPQGIGSPRRYGD